MLFLVHGLLHSMGESHIEANKLLVRRFVEDVWNGGQLALLDQIIHPVYYVPGVGQGSAAVARNIASFRLAFPDLVWTLEDMVAEGDRVAVRLVLTGTHLGPFRDIAWASRAIARTCA